MKIKSIVLLLIITLCLCITSCGNDEVKRPIDYPETTWICEDGAVTFTVSENGEIADASMVNANGETVNITIEFSDISEKKVSIMSADGSEKYLEGVCTYGKDKFTVTVSDIYGPDFSNMPLRMNFVRSDT